MREGRGLQKSDSTGLVATACAVTICLAFVGAALGPSSAGATPPPNPAPLWKEFPLKQSSGRTRASTPRASDIATPPAGATRIPSSASDSLRLGLLISAGLGALVAILLLSRMVVTARWPVADAAGNRGRHRSLGSSGPAFVSAKRLGGATRAPPRATWTFARVLGEQIARRRGNVGELADEPIDVAPETSAAAAAEVLAPEAAPAPVADRIAAFVGTAVSSVEDDQPRAAAEPVSTAVSPAARDEPEPTRRAGAIDPTPETSAVGEALPLEAAPAPTVADRFAAEGVGTAGISPSDDRPRAAAEPIATVATPAAREEPAPYRRAAAIMSAPLRAVLADHRAGVSIYAIGIAAACAIGWLAAHLVS
jgi:hypothetical protein